MFLAITHLYFQVFKFKIVCTSEVFTQNAPHLSKAVSNDEEAGW